VQQVAAQIPWFHNCLLLDKVKDPGKREWYIRQTIENGWSRSVLVPEGNRSQFATGSNEAIAKS
jgi:predicted nuclease of restriction endonuclease-like (RecB) superfamily